MVVEITDERGDALRVLRNALHRAAVDHDIKCRDVPVGKSRPATSGKLKLILEALFHEDSRDRSKSARRDG